MACHAVTPHGIRSKWYSILFTRKRTRGQVVVDMCIECASDREQCTRRPHRNPPLVPSKMALAGRCVAIFAESLKYGDR